jgi:hypothetical protein
MIGSVVEVWTRLIKVADAPRDTMNHAAPTD